MKTLLSEHASSPPLKIKGRMIPFEEFTARLKNYCRSQGFRQVKISSSISPSFSAGTGPGIVMNNTEEDEVIILSCKVSYNPQWGSSRGLPHQLVRAGVGKTVEQCPAGFIAPFLQQYRFAQEHIFLSQTLQGQHLISLPKCLIQQGRRLEDPGTLTVRLENIAESGTHGDFATVWENGEMLTYALSDSFLQHLADQNHSWKPGPSIPIGRFLTSQFFTFPDVERSVDPATPFKETLLPHLSQILTHRTPNLRAAEIHLRQEFSRTLERVTAAYRTRCKNMLWLAGLDIDMASFKGQGGQYFVPWKAYLKRTGRDSGEEFSLEQDDLFVLLMQQEKRCSA